MVKWGIFMKRSSTHILRGCVIIAGIVMIAICGTMAWITFTEGRSELQYSVDPRLIVLFIGTCMAAVPYFIALYQTFKLLGYIDAGRAFTPLSVEVLASITRCAIADFTICLVGAVPFFTILGRSDGNPGMGLFGLIPTCVAFVIAVFSGVLKRLLNDAIAAKSENDLTI
jgi:hypothetical protein